MVLIYFLGLEFINFFKLLRLLHLCTTFPKKTYSNSYGTGKLIGISIIETI
jgi:hypothetical protein